MALPISSNSINLYLSSWLLSRTALGITRLIFSLYAFITIFVILGLENSRRYNPYAAAQSFSYFTNLTYWGLAFYFLVSGLYTLSFARAGRNALKGRADTSILETQPKVLRRAYEVFYSTVVVFPIIVTIVFWAVLSGPRVFATRFETWANISQHALNSGFALFEIIIPRTNPLPFWHLIPLILVLALYLALVYITHATQGFYTYSFLDIGRNGSGKVAGYCIGILVGAIIIFLLVWSAIWVRRRLTERRGIKQAQLEGGYGGNGAGIELNQLGTTR